MDLFALSLEEILENIESGKFNDNDVLILFKRADLTEKIIRAISQNSEWIRKHKIQEAIVNYPKSPLVLARRFVEFLYWKELATLAGNHRANPVVRKIAENYLKNKLSKMTLGEKITLSKMPVRSVVVALRLDGNIMITRSLLINSRLTEEDVLFMINKFAHRKDVLELIARSPKWSNRYQVKFELLKRPGTPIQISLGLIHNLMIADLKALRRVPVLHPTLRRAVEKLIQKKTEGRYN